MVSGLVNVLVEECLCLREISVKVNKLLGVLLLPVYLFIRFYFILYFVVACLLLYPPFLIVNHVNKPIIFDFGAFVYYFKNTISIFVII